MLERLAACLGTLTAAILISGCAQHHPTTASYDEERSQQRAPMRSRHVDRDCHSGVRSVIDFETCIARRGWDSQ